MHSIFKLPDFVLDNQQHNDKHFVNEQITPRIIIDHNYFLPLAKSINQYIQKNLQQYFPSANADVKIYTTKNNILAFNNYLKAAWYASGAGLAPSELGNFMISITNIFGPLLPTPVYGMHISILNQNTTDRLIDKTRKLLNKHYIRQAVVATDVIIATTAPLYTAIKDIRSKHRAKPTFFIPELHQYIQLLHKKIRRTTTLASADAMNSTTNKSPSAPSYNKEPLPPLLVKILATLLSWYHDYPFMRWIQLLDTLETTIKESQRYRCI